MPNTHGSEPMLHKSTQVKYPIDRLKYDGYTTHHYAYMTEVIHESELMNLILHVLRKQ